MKVHRVLLAGACFLGLIVIGVAGEDTAKKLVGVWKVIHEKEGAPESTIEFNKDGKCIMKSKSGDKELKLDRTYKLKGDMLTVALGKDMETAKIAKLTEKELVINDEGGKARKFQRVK